MGEYDMASALHSTHTSRFVSLHTFCWPAHLWNWTGTQWNVVLRSDLSLRALFYTTSKVLIYAFLTEKVYIVWENGVRGRLKSPVFLVCIGTVTLYFGIILTMFFERIAEFRIGDKACVIGLKPTASLPLLAFDLYINLLLTTLFLWPLLRTNIVNPRLKRVATRTSVASMAALTTSTVNIAVLTILHGRELGWLCLASCGIDVVFNATALFWVTSRRVVSPNTQANTERAASPDSLHPSSRRHSQLKPFKLRPKSAIPRKFEIYVTTSSMVETSPPCPHSELPPESPIEEEKPESCVEPEAESSMEEETNEETLDHIDEAKRYSAADSEKTL
ncbi:hypothetical protein MSAN_02301300 [Mycena sanguinolenta]|uniref:Transmembrane protein n=1 Tax=Mycena sanguinolenta TaxID=230812 RepID=A0A8H6X9C6_9AGAR|nr:hypothetical protein MSAN_02301300 [Mycena sanguinolenta]